MKEMIVWSHGDKSDLMSAARSLSIQSAQEHDQATNETAAATTNHALHSSSLISLYVGLKWFSNQ